LDGELDLNTTEKQIMLNGFTYSGGDQSNFIDLFRDNNPVTIAADKILPASVSTFISLGAEDIQQLNRQFNEYLKGIGKADERKNRLQHIVDKYGINPGIAPEFN
jgi:hypothetical protein